MKKIIIFIIYISFCISLFSFTQRFHDTIKLTNTTNEFLDITYRGSTILTESSSFSKKLDLGERSIRVRGGTFYGNTIENIVTYKTVHFLSYAYDYTRYYKMGWFARFLLITEELSIKDEDGNILLTLETLTPDDFEVTEEYGDVEANLIVDESSIEKWKVRQKKTDVVNQQFGTVFNIKNETNEIINVEYSLSSMLTENAEGQTYILDLGTNQISINAGLLQEQQNILLKDDTSFLISNYSYDYWKLNKMGWFAQFMLITGKLIVKDDTGKVLLNLDTISPEDFEVTEENGKTTATLVIRDKF